MQRDTCVAQPLAIDHGWLLCNRIGHITDGRNRLNLQLLCLFSRYLIRCGFRSRGILALGNSLLVILHQCGDHSILLFSKEYKIVDRGHHQLKLLPVEQTEEVPFFDGLANLPDLIVVKMVK